jgi:hypothetical protein
VVHLGAPPFQDNSGVHELMIAGNTIHAMVPAALERDRHGIFVGDFTSAHILDTIATLRRPGLEFVADSSPVEGIRIWGWRGYFLVIRQTSLLGFGPIGIRIDPSQQQNTGRLWLVAETMAAGASTAVHAPGGVDRERNYGP